MNGFDKLHFAIWNASPPEVAYKTRTGAYQNGPLKDGDMVHINAVHADITFIITWLVHVGTQFAEGGEIRRDLALAILRDWIDQGLQVLNMAGLF